MILTLKDSAHLSLRNYDKISKATDLPSNYILDKTKNDMNMVFDIQDNSLGYYNDPIEKIKFVLNKYIENTQASCREEIKIKISVDGLQLTRTHRQILTVTFTLLNENKRATTSKGNYLLGK